MFTSRDAKSIDTSVAVTEGRRNGQFAFLFGTHADESLVQSFDNLASTQIETEWLVLDQTFSETEVTQNEKLELINS